MNSCEKIIEDVLTENYGQFYRLAYGYVRNEEDALDIVQERSEMRRTPWILSRKAPIKP